MARYTNEDQRNLEELLEEGLFDRMKAYGANAIGAVKGAGQQLKGKAQQAYGNVLNKTAELGGQALGVDTSQGNLAQKGLAMQQAGQSNVQAGSTQGENSKIDYLKKNISKRIDNFVANLNNDIQKLGLNIGNIEFASEIEDALEGLKQNLGSTPSPSPQQQTQATPPLLPPQQQTQATQDNVASGQVEPKQTNPRFMSANARKKYEKEQALKRSASGKKGAMARNSKQSQIVTNPKKSKTREYFQRPLGQDEEDLEELFWK